MTFYQFPMIFTFFCCLLYYQRSTSISHSFKQLKIEFYKNFTTEYVIQFFHKLTCLIDLSNKLDEILSPLSFYLLSLYIVELFSIVASLVEISFSSMKTPFMYFTVFHSTHNKLNWNLVNNYMCFSN